MDVLVELPGCLQLLYCKRQHVHPASSRLPPAPATMEDLLLRNSASSMGNLALVIPQNILCNRICLIADPLRLLVFIFEAFLHILQLLLQIQGSPTIIRRCKQAPQVVDHLIPFTISRQFLSRENGVSGDVGYAGSRLCLNMPCNRHRCRSRLDSNDLSGACDFGLVFNV